jgi:hypothetical protein
VKHLHDIPVWLFALLTVASFDAIALGVLIGTHWLGHGFGLYARWCPHVLIGDRHHEQPHTEALAKQLKAVFSCSTIEAAAL